MNKILQILYKKEKRKGESATSISCMKKDNEEKYTQAFSKAVLSLFRGGRVVLFLPLFVLCVVDNPLTFVPGL